MRIGIDAQRLFRKQKHGIEIYILQLLLSLQKIDITNEYFIFVKSGEDSDCIKETSNFHIICTKKIPYPIWEQLYLPCLAYKYDIDFLHCPSGTGPLLCRNIISTIHDIIPLERTFNTNRNNYQRFGDYYRRLILPLLFHRSKAVITVTNSEKHIIIEK